MKTEILKTVLLSGLLMCCSVLLYAQVPSYIIGATTVCRGDGVNYTLNTSTCHYVQWSMGGGGSGVPTQNGANLGALWTTAGVFTLNAYVPGGGAGCFDPTFNLSVQVTVIDKPGLPSLTRNSSNSELCGSESWTFTATTSGYSSSYGYDWYVTGGGLINGSTSSPSIIIHTTSNQVTFTAGSGYGYNTIYARLNNTVACPSPWANFSTQLGPYNSDQFNIGGPSNACSGTNLSFNSSLGGPPVTGYLWNAPSGWSQTTSSSASFNTTTPWGFSGGAVVLRLQNRCGWTGSPDVKYISSGGCFMRMATSSPNPASAFVELSETNEQGESGPISEGTTVQVFDKAGTLQRTHVVKTKGTQLDVSDLPDGLYFLRFKAGSETITRQVVVQH